MPELNTIYNMPCEDGMNCLLNDNSIDSIVTDPPYELGFMGKKWDATGIAYSVGNWKEAWRVLKPGGYLLAFGGTRTNHRMVCAIEDAGFEIRDQIQWLYGCLSEDTEILTVNGWERYHKNIEYNPVLCYDIDKDTFEFYKPEGSFIYENKHTAYRIQSDFTDQIVSRNHRCIIERDGRKVFAYAETLEQQESVPILESLHALPETIPNIREGTSIEKKDLLKRVRQQECWEKQFSSEVNKSCSFRQQNRKSYAIRGQQKTQAIRGTRATVTPIKYTGKVWCVQIPTGAFVARRKGRIFITGNSGFPKSLNISKAIEKAAGIKGEIINKKTYPDIRSNNYSNSQGKTRLCGGDYLPISKKGIQWDGWGTALKPASEPICVARKPLSEKTVAKNVLKWGTGGINIEDCRVGKELIVQRQKNMKVYHNNKLGAGATTNMTGVTTQTQGRFPANVILDEEAGRLLDEMTGELKSGSLTGQPRGENKIYGSAANTLGAPRYHVGDSGGASRFFYCAKTSKKERGEDNDHPTVKPIKLISYLVRLVTPPNGIVLDPFAGSGTLCVSCILEGFNYVVFERSRHYCGIAENRVKAARIIKTEPDKNISRIGIEV